MTRKLSSGEPIIFSEWELVKKTPTMIKVHRTEYSLDEIFAGNSKESGTQAELPEIKEQLDLFLDFDLELEVEQSIQKFKEVYITEVYSEELVYE